MKIPEVGNILIEKIGEKIEKKLEQLNLTPEISPEEFLKEHKTGKHRYFSPCITRENKRVAFYARLHFNLDAKRKFLTEIKFLKKLKKSKLKIKKLVPQIIDYGIEKDFEWFLREFPPGNPLGKSRNLQQNLSQNLAPKLAKIIYQISKIQPDFFGKLRKFKVENYLAKKVYQRLLEKKILEKKLVFEISKFIQKNLSLLKKENKYFCHGDLNLGNVISDGKNLSIIDWELIHLNNFAYDIGYFWTHLWQAKREFRNALIFSFLKELPFSKREKFKILFPIVVSFVALGGVLQKLKNKRETKERKNFYLKLLKNCLNFEKLIKL